jgi:signal peptidase I
MPKVKQRKPIIALGLSLLTPGLGQIYNGQFSKGIVIFLFAFSAGLLTDILRVSSSFRGAVFEFTASLIFTILVMIDVFVTAKKVGQIELRNYNRWYIYVGIVLVVILVGEIPYFKTYDTYRMGSGSMLPSMVIGDRLVTDLKAYQKSSPQRGDVVVLKYPEDPKKVMVKRVIGLPAEKIEIRDKLVLINDQPLNEPYIQIVDKFIIPGSVQPRDNMSPVQIPRQCFFVMGDNRDQSYDSRFWGCVDAGSIRAKVLYIYWSPDFSRIGLQIK